jgi:hypothetical protein
VETTPPSTPATQADDQSSTPDASAPEFTDFGYTEALELIDSKHLDITPAQRAAAAARLAPLLDRAASDDMPTYAEIEATTREVFDSLEHDASIHATPEPDAKSDAGPTDTPTVAADTTSPPQWPNDQEPQSFGTPDATTDVPVTRVISLEGAMSVVQPLDSPTPLTPPSPDSGLEGSFEDVYLRTAGVAEPEPFDDTAAADTLDEATTDDSTSFADLAEAASTEQLNDATPAAATTADLTATASDSPTPEPGYTRVYKDALDQFTPERIAQAVAFDLSVQRAVDAITSTPHMFLGHPGTFEDCALCAALITPQTQETNHEALRAALASGYQARLEEPLRDAITVAIEENAKYYQALESASSGADVTILGITSPQYQKESASDRQLADRQAFDTAVHALVAEIHSRDNHGGDTSSCPICQDPTNAQIAYEALRAAMRTGLQSAIEAPLRTMLDELSAENALYYTTLDQMIAITRSVRSIADIAPEVTSDTTTDEAPTATEEPS